MQRVAIMVLAATIAACSEAPPPPRPVETDVPPELRRPAPATAARPAASTGNGTPMKDRVAIIGVLNKRNNIAQDLTMKPGETRRVGDVVVALKACERTAPWEMPRETGAFVQVFVDQGGAQGGGGFAKVFSGWLFRESPSLNVVEHPIYDVWVKDCTMRFPGEEGTPTDSASPSPTGRAAPRFSPRATSPPSPEASVEADANDAIA